jgi:hypothetical protein
MNTSEQALRREAIRRRLSGEPRRDICQDLERSTRWFDKWWSEFRNNPHTDFADHSRAPLTVWSITTPALERLVIALRHAFESANHGLIGARAIWGKLIEPKVKPLPSEATIQRILARHELTHPVGAATEMAYYPWLPVGDVNAVQATNLITKHIWGGTEIQNFHTLDLFTQAVCLTESLDKTSATTCTHLLKAWEKLGLPCLQQFDTEGAFCGGHTHRRVIGRVVRLCLFCGVEAFSHLRSQTQPPDRDVSQSVVSGVLDPPDLHRSGARPCPNTGLYAMVSSPLPASLSEGQNARTDALWRQGPETDNRVALTDPRLPSRAFATHRWPLPLHAQGRPLGSYRISQRAMAGWLEVDWRVCARHDQHGQTDAHHLAQGFRPSRLASDQKAELSDQGVGSCSVTPVQTKSRTMS